MDFYQFIMYFVLLMVIVTVVSKIYSTSRREKLYFFELKQEYDLRSKEDDKWLEEEKLKPRYCVSFTTKKGYKTKFITGFTPKNSKIGDISNIRMTSKRRAEIYISFCFKRGFFLDGDGKYYPIHAIESAKLEIEDEG